MNIQERIETLETEFNEKIKALKAEVQQEKEFPQEDDMFWVINTFGKPVGSTWGESITNRQLIEIGNMFRTKDEAEFAVEKLKVEAELQKFGRPFEPTADNFFMVYDKYLESLENNCSLKTDIQGVIYFGSREELRKAAQSVGVDRIKKYIFGVED